MKEKDLFRLSLIASLTLGLAPFVPEPHIWKQILNLTLGRPMYTLDWIDVAMHGAPWLLFIILGIRKLTGKANS
jgi:hypothetical protein